jgi:glycosyltransferase involved in cell wall biosynthesis
MIQDRTAIGGAAVSLLGLVEQLSLAGFDVTVSANDNGELIPAFQAAGADVRRNDFHRPVNLNTSRVRIVRDLFSGGCYNLRAIFSLRRLCADRPPDIVYLNTSPMLHLAPVIRSCCGAKIVYHVREHWNVSAVPWVSALRSYLIDRYVDLVITNTQVAADSVGVPDKTQVIHNWPLVEDVVPPADMQALFGISENSPVLLLPGGRIFHKGSITAIQAMKHVKAKDATLLILGGFGGEPHGVKGWLRKILSRCGRPPYGKRLQAEAEALFPRVVMAPFCKDIAPIMRASVCVICPFTKPHFARPAIEAAAQERPAVLADWPEAREVVTHGKNGLLFSASDARALADQVNLLLGDPEWANKMGRTARTVAEMRYTKKRNVSKLVALLQKGL